MCLAKKNHCKFFWIICEIFSLISLSFQFQNSFFSMNNKEFLNFIVLICFSGWLSTLVMSLRSHSWKSHCDKTLSDSFYQPLAHSHSCFQPLSLVFFSSFSSLFLSSSSPKWMTEGPFAWSFLQLKKKAIKPKMYLQTTHSFLLSILFSFS